MLQIHWFLPFRMLRRLTAFKSLVSMILNGPSLKDQGKRESQACLTIGQGILYNTKKGTSGTDVKKSRHTLEREPPLPIYIGMNVHECSCDTIRRMGNPFLDDFPDLVTLDSRNCADESVVAALHTLVDTGKKQYQDFVKNVIAVRSHSIHDPIKRNSLALFKNPRHKTTSTQGRKIKTLQNNVALFGQLMYQCRAEMVIWPNYLHMRYSPSLPHSQTLANFICQARNLTC